MPVSAGERDNGPRWRVGRRGFYEVWYVKANDLASRTALWVRYTLRVPRRGPGVAEVWGAWFDAGHPSRSFAVKRSGPLDSFSATREPFAVRIGRDELTHTSARGRLEGPAGRLGWDLSWEPSPEPCRPYAFDALYRLPYPPTKWLVPNPSVQVEGTVDVHDAPRRLSSAPGEQAHVWGTRHAAEWAWCHANAFHDAPGVVLEALSARTRPGGPVRSIVWLRTPPRTFAWSWPLVRGVRTEYRLGAWRLTASYGRSRIEVDVRASPQRFVGVRYEDPDGSTRICHNTKIADATVRLLRRVAGSWIVQDAYRAAESAAFEVVLPEADPRVRVHV